MKRGALLLSALWLVACEEPVGDPAPAVRSFFDHLAAGKVDAAYDDASLHFQYEQSRKEFIATVHDFGFVRCDFVSAEQPKISDKTAEQNVVIRTPRGTQRPLHVTLVRDRRAWRIYSIKAPMNLETGLTPDYFSRIGRGAGFERPQEYPIPDERTIHAMTKETMLQFHDAIQQKSFEVFYENVARAWQRQLTLGMLTRTFEGFIQRRTNLVAIRGLEATLTEPPRIDSDGLLTVSGVYPAQPYRIQFEMKYFYELPNWRPFGVTVRLIN